MDEAKVYRVFGPKYLVGEIESRTPLCIFLDKAEAVDYAIYLGESRFFERGHVPLMDSLSTDEELWTTPDDKDANIPYHWGVFCLPPPT